MQPDKMEALIHRKIKNVDISLDKSKTTIFQKMFEPRTRPDSGEVLLGDAG